jgi:hypothetical protein
VNDVKKGGAHCDWPKKGGSVYYAVSFTWNLTIKKRAWPFLSSDTAIVGQSVIIHYFSETGPPVQSTLNKTAIGFHPAPAY